MKKMPKQKKTNTREEKEIIQDYFMDCRFRFQDQYKEKVKLIEKNFPLYAVDKTQVPCLLTMDIINNAKANMTEKDFKSYRAYVEDVLNGWRPPVKFDVIEGGKK